MLMRGITFLSACMAASLTSRTISTPTNPLVEPAYSSMILFFSSSESGTPRVCTWKISMRPFLSGIPISISRSNRPPRRSAGLMESGRLVAAITITCTRPFNPSMSARSWATTRRSSSPLVSSRLGAMKSTSSMKMIDGELACASSKTSRSFPLFAP